MGLMGFWCVISFGILFCKWGVNGFTENGTDTSFREAEYGGSAAAVPPGALMVGLTLIQGTHANKGAVCLDGTQPGYHLHRGSGWGADKWIVNLEGGGWCGTIEKCVRRKKSRHGSSNHFEKQIPFTRILSNKHSENPGDSEDKANWLQFRGQLIWKAAIDDLKPKGLGNAKQALLSGCSAGGLATILHCDEFRDLLPRTARVKCLSDAGLFMDAADISGGHAIRNFLGGVVSLQGVAQNLPKTCHLQDQTLCFFPQHLIDDIKTPLFILNAAYDSWQVQQSLTPPQADPLGKWTYCRKRIVNCSQSQIQILQGFRDQMLRAVKRLEASGQSGVFINSCFAHCQSESQETWFAKDSPVIRNKAIATAVSDWYFDRARVKETDCPFPCDKTCPT